MINHRIISTLVQVDQDDDAQFAYLDSRVPSHDAACDASLVTVRQISDVKGHCLQDGGSLK